MATKSVKNNNREGKPRMTSQQKKMRRQQVFMTVVGIVLVLAMVLTMVVQY